MNNNIINKYLDFSIKNLTKYIRIIFPKMKVKDTQLIFEKYKEIRYFNYLNDSQGEIKSSFINSIKKNVESLNLFSKYNEIELKYVYTIIINIIYLDDLLNEEKINLILKNITDYYYKLYNEKLDVSELKKIVKSDVNAKLDYLKKIKSDKFFVKYKKYNRDLFDTSLLYELKFPKLYSQFAIDRVYNSDMINEQKNMVLYNLISLKVLNDVINYNFNTKYMVDYPISILDKEDKNKRLFKFIDNDIVKDKLLIKFEYNVYLKNIDYVNKLIESGYHLVVYFKDLAEFDEISIMKLNIFDHILVYDQKLYDYYKILSHLVIYKE